MIYPTLNFRFIVYVRITILFNKNMIKISDIYVIITIPNINNLFLYNKIDPLCDIILWGVV